MGRSHGNQNRIIVLGHIAGVHGIRGWVQVFSHTEPREAILDYRPWLLGDGKRPVEPLDGARHGKTVIVRLEGIEDRDQAERLVGQTIGVERRDLPELGQGQFYWADLIGLEVVLKDGESLGTVEDLMATGAHDVLVVRGDRERLIPFVLDRTVLKVDFESLRITVDWDADY